MSNNIVTSTTIVKAEVELEPDELAVIVRDEIQQAQAAWRNALRHAMNAGDALIAAQPKVTEQGINWKKWLRDNCFVSDRTAQLYQQLARHRPEIEAELQSRGDLSLRGARQLISARRDEDDEGAGDDAGEHHAGGQEHEGDGQGVDYPCNPALSEFFSRASGVDIYDWIPVDRRNEVARGLLDKFTVTGVLEAMSEEFGRQLRDRMPKLKSNGGA